MTYVEERGVRVDWIKIKTEYVTTDTTYRELAEKYGISQTQVANHSKDEGWRKLREEHLQNICKKALNTVANQQAGRMARLQTVADKLLDKIENMVDAMEITGGTIDKQSLKQLSGALRDIKEIQNLKSDIDIREQEARIRNLEKQAEDSTGSDKEIKITICGNAEEFTK